MTKSRADLLTSISLLQEELFALGVPTILIGLTEVKHSDNDLRAMIEEGFRQVEANGFTEWPPVPADTVKC